MSGCDTLCSAHALPWQRPELVVYTKRGDKARKSAISSYPHYHERAKAIAAVLSSLPGVAVLPDPPQTHMMHVFLPGERERLMQAAIRLAREERVAHFGGLMGTEMPGYVKFELAVGDASDALSDDEIWTYFARVLEEANTGTRSAVQ